MAFLGRLFSGNPKRVTKNDLEMTNSDENDDYLSSVQSELLSDDEIKKRAIQMCKYIGHCGKIWKETIQELEKYQTADMQDLLQCENAHNVEHFFSEKGKSYKKKLRMGKHFCDLYTYREHFKKNANLKEYLEFYNAKNPDVQKSILDALFEYKNDNESFKNFKDFLYKCDDEVLDENKTPKDKTDSEETEKINGEGASNDVKLMGTKLKNFRQLLVERKVAKDIRRLEILLKLDYDDKYTDYKAIAKELIKKCKELEEMLTNLEALDRWDKSGTTPLIEAFHNYTKLIMLDLEKNLLEDVCSEDLIKIIYQTLMIHGNFATPLSFLCQHGTIEMFEALMKIKHDSQDIWTLVSTGANREKWVAPIDEQNQDTDGRTLIHFAAMNYSDEILQFLYKHNLFQSGRDFSVPTAKGNTPLHYAAAAGRIKCVDFLLGHNVQYDAMNANFETPLHMAANGGDIRTFNHIYKKYPEEEECLKKEALFGPPLLYAAKSRRYECIGAILDKQMDADATVHDKDCDTTLHYISKDAPTRWLSKVLKANALLGKKNEVGNSPIDWISKDKLQELLDKQTFRVNMPDTGDTSRKDYVEILFTNIFGHHASGSDMKNIIAIAQTPAVEDLALHPLCQAIVSVKWQKIMKFFMLKLLFFVPFVFCTSAHPILTMQKDYMIKYPEENSTFTLETITNLIDYSYTIFLFLLAIQIVFGLLSIFVLVQPFFEESGVYISFSEKKFSMRRVKRLLEFWIQELVWSDWYEYLLWIVAILYVYEMISPILVVVTSWFALFYVCSNHPSILPFRYMLFAILTRYLRFLIFSFGLIGGFALGFYLLANKCRAEGESCVKADSGFESLLTTALKVPSMMMGEISYETFEFKTSPYMQFLFGSFIFLMTCCMFNMMNGLAINITTEFEKKAHIFSTIAQCEMIEEFEVLLKEIHSWLKWIGVPGELRTLNALWVERIKVRPSTGDCQLLEEYNKDFHGPVEGPTSKLKKEDLFETNNKSKVAWVWVDRGYSLSSKIIRNALERSEETNNVYKDPADVEIDFEDLQMRRSSTKGGGNQGGGADMMSNLPGVEPNTVGSFNLNVPKLDLSVSTPSLATEEHVEDEVDATEMTKLLSTPGELTDVKVE